MSQTIMAQKQKTLAKAGEANPDMFTVSRTGTTGYTHGHKSATGFLMESRMQGNSHVRFGERGRRNHDEESSYRRFCLYSTWPLPAVSLCLLSGVLSGDPWHAFPRHTGGGRAHRARLGLFG